MALNLSAETLARVSARRPWLVVAAWAAVFAVSIALIATLLSGGLTNEMGFGLAVAVLLDATIVRSILVPAAMQLLGARNWYLPSVLRWLPEMRMERREGTAASSEAS